VLHNSKESRQNLSTAISRNVVSQNGGTDFVYVKCESGGFILIVRTIIRISVYRKMNATFVCEASHGIVSLEYSCIRLHN
jgi:hypothetical protein